MSEPTPVRLIPLGLAPDWHTQAVYHAVAERMTSASPDTIIITQPASAYLCLGYHQALDKILDRQACAERELPIFRRKLGGGATYLDWNQLFYQFVFHSSRVPAQAKRVYRQALEAPLKTLQRIGLDASLHDDNEIRIGGKRVAGIGGGQIGEASVVVGNFLFDFDYNTMSAVWQTPSEAFRRLAEGALREHLTTLDEEGVTQPMEKIADLLIEEYSSSLKRPLQKAALTEEEIQTAGRIGTLLQSESFLNLAPNGAAAPLKIAAGVFIHSETRPLEDQVLRIHYCVRDGVIESVDLESPRIDQQRFLEEALGGLEFARRDEILLTAMGLS